MRAIFNGILTLQMLLTAIALVGQSPIPALPEIKSMYYRGEYEQIIRVVGPHMDQTQDAELLLLLGDAEHKMDFFDVAIKCYKKAEKLGLNREELFFHRSAAYISSKEYKKAIKDLNASIAKNPDNPTYYFYRGYAHTELNKLDKALADYTLALERKKRLCRSTLQQGSD